MFNISPLAENPPPWEGDQAFLDLVDHTIWSAPGSPAGDYAFFAWLYDFYGHAIAPPEKGAHKPEHQKKVEHSSQK